MLFALKRVSHSPRQSEETLAFAADIWCDGKKVGYAKNDGNGGSTLAMLHGGWISDAESKKINDWIDAQPAKTIPADPKYGTKEYTEKVSLETIVDDLFGVWYEENYGIASQKKKWCKTKVVFRLKGDKDGSYRTVKKDTAVVKGIRIPNVYTQSIKDWLTKTYGDKIEEIVNETLGEKPV